MATSTSSNSDAEDSRQSWDISTNPICLSTISKRKSAFLPYKPNTSSPPAIIQSSLHRPAIPSSPATPHDAGAAAASSATPPSGTAGPGAGPNNSCVLTNLQRGNTEAPTPSGDIALSFHERCGQGEVTDAQVAALERDGAAIDRPDQFQYTALHWAAHYGQLHTVQQLIGHGAHVNRLAPDHVSALLLAAAGGHHEVVRCLLQHGADAQHTDIVGNTALMFAAAGNHPHTTNELLASGQRNLMATNEEGDTAYSLAVQNRALLAQQVLENYIVAMLAGS